MIKSWSVWGVAMRSVAVVSVFLFAVSAFAITKPTPNEVEAQLKDFDTNTVQYLNSPPQMRVATKAIPEANFLKNLAFDEINRAKDETRRELIARSEKTKFAEGSTPIEKFLVKDELVGTGGVIVRSPQEMERLKFLSALLPKAAWSGSGWPTYVGRVAIRYSNSDYMAHGNDFAGLYRFVNSEDNSLKTIYAKRKPKQLDTLSPTEKYDLLIGDASDSPTGYLARKQWERGYNTYKKYGRVPTWHGICHGWAPASFMMTRPTRVIEVTAADGVTKIKFWPTDLKGLASLIWADGIAPVRFLGSRCNIESPKKDDNGRVIQPECFDTNPGLFHMAVVNQLSSAKRNLIVDSNYDLEVWNRPIVGYAYTYFNPQSKDSVDSLAEAIVTRADFKKDKFKAYRSPNAASFVGIAMKVRFLDGAGLNHRTTDSAENDNYGEKTYLYDLELDASGNIIGGEWYKNAHPDFAWMPRATARATSSFEAEATSSWNGTGALPKDWQAAARNASAKGQPLAKIVEALLQQAK
jgi:hypothetical protein